jgi:hypothetical protein
VDPNGRDWSVTEVMRADEYRVEILQQHRTRQLCERLGTGEDWHESDLVLPAVLFDVLW